ncbi:MAG: response regulator [Chloroflexota bacterium]
MGDPRNNRPRSVLIVDSDAVLSRLMKHNLEDESTAVTQAGTGLDCMKVLSEKRIDLLLLDTALPDFNGWGILSLLRLTAPLRGILIVMMTTDAPSTALIQGLKPDDCIQKPFDMRDLVNRVGKLMSSAGGVRVG